MIQPANKRIHSIDILRGLVMVIMVLDHVRDLFHTDSLTIDPTNLATTYPALFFTRWITHLCAPSFVFLAGISVYLSKNKSGDIAASRKLLITRGCWLVLLEFTVVNFGIWFDIHFPILLFQVIGAIGFSFIAIGCLISLKPWIPGMIGVLMLLFHNLLPPGIPLFSPATYPIGANTTLLLAYPPFPWMGLLFTGYWFGASFRFQDPAAPRRLLQVGLGCLLAFGLLRWLNSYGDPAPWSVQASPLYSFMSFINVTKYPPSLLYVLLMLGILFSLLSIAKRFPAPIATVLQVYGAVPFFFYLIHWYLAHLLLLLFLRLQGYQPGEFVFGFRFGRPEGENGLQLGYVYLVWMLVVFLLYPLCKWYRGYKQAHPENRYLKYL